MRISPIAATIVFAACSPSNGTDIPTPQPGAPSASHSLFAGHGSLRGEEITELRDGVWVVRRVGSASRGRLGESGRFALGDAAPTGAALPTAPMDSTREFDSVAAVAAEPSLERGAAASGLRAGSTDDNDDLAGFLAYLAEHEQRADLRGRWQPLDVADMRRIRVVDADGAPVPGVVTRVVDEDADRIAWRGTTQGDGCVPFYPRLAAGESSPATWLVEAEVGGQIVRQHWDMSGEECVIRAPGRAKTDAEVALDVVFVIDTTGSMGDEIQRIKATLLAVTEKLRSLEREFTLRYGAVLYRDVGDDYVTSAHPFTDDIEAFDEALAKIEASGGGDGPESLNQGLAVAVDQMEWRPGAARVAFLIADAPPHMDYEGDVPYGDSLEAAVASGIRIHSVAASGLDDVGSLVFRQIAQFTRGEFVFIEYGGDVTASGKAHGIAGVKKSNNLDDILFEKIRDEIATWGREG